MTPTARIGNVRVSFSLLFPAMLALLCSLQQGRLTAWCLLAAVMHECGHLLMLCLLGNRPREIRFSAFGMCLVLGDTPMRRRHHIVTALGGPLVNLLTAAILTTVGGDRDILAIHLLLGLFNLLPIYPLDGGQCLSEGWSRRLVSYIVLSLLTVLAVYMVVQGNISLIVVTLYLWFHQGKG